MADEGDAGWSWLNVGPRIASTFGRDLSRQADVPMRRAGDKAGQEFGDAAGKKGGETFSSKVADYTKKGVILAGGAAGLVFGGAFASALDRESLTDKLAAQLGAGDQRAKLLGKVSGDLYKDAFGDSIGNVDDTLRTVITNLDGFQRASKQRLEAVTGDVLNLNAAFDEEPAAITRAAAQLVRTGLSKNVSDALDVITTGFQSGADKSEDLLDTLNEYPTQFRKLGLTGKQVLGLLSQGLKGGARDSDLVADSLKEFSIRAVDGSKTTSQAFKALGLDVDDTVETIAKGGPGAAQALQDVFTNLGKVEDPAKRSRIAVKLFGTQAEDMGQALYDLDLDHLPAKFDRVAGATDRMGNRLNDNAKSKITEFTRTLKLGVVDFLGNRVIPAIEDFADGKDGKKLGKVFSDAAHDIRPVAKDLLPAAADTLGDVAGAVAKAAPAVEKIVNAYTSLPDWAQKAIVLGAGAGYLGKKTGILSLGRSALTGGGSAGTASGGLLGLVSKSKPIPVFVVNEGFGGAGGGPGGLLGSGAEGAGKASLVSRFGRLAGAATIGGSLLEAGDLYTKKTNQNPLTSLPTLLGVAVEQKRTAEKLSNFFFNRHSDSIVPATLLPEQVQAGIDLRRADIPKIRSTSTVVDALNAGLATTSRRLDLVGAKGGKSFADLTHDGGEFRSLLSGLPTKVQTQVLTPGLIDSRRDIQGLKRDFDLTPHQVSTLYRLTGIDKARAEFDALQSHMGRHTTLSQQLDLATGSGGGGGMHVHGDVNVTANDPRTVDRWARDQRQRASLDGTRRGVGSR